MALDHARVRKYLREFDLRGLFTQELGWDHHHGNLQVTVEGQDYTLRACAEKRGVQILECPPDDGGKIPDYNTGAKYHKGHHFIPDTF